MYSTAYRALTSLVRSWRRHSRASTGSTCCHSDLSSQKRISGCSAATTIALGVGRVLPLNEAPNIWQRNQFSSDRASLSAAPNRARCSRRAATGNWSAMNLRNGDRGRFLRDLTWQSSTLRRIGRQQRRVALEFAADRLDACFGFQPSAGLKHLRHPKEPAQLYLPALAICGPKH